MYRLIYIISFLIRQFVLPNPFTPLGNNAEAINLIFGAIFVPISYFMTGWIYDRGSGPFIGSLLFLVVYTINTVVVYLVCLVYPTIWLMIVIALLYVILFRYIAVRWRE